MGGGALFGTLGLFILLSMPLAFGILALTLLSYLIAGDTPLVTMAQGIWFNLNHYSYSSVIYFVLAGYIMSRGQLARRLLDVADAFFGWLPGGFAISGVVACGLFGSITGSDLATLAAIGTIIVPAMVQRGWSKEFAVGLAGSSALLGLLIPPSIPVIVYAIFVNISISGLFLATVIPGILLITFFSLYVVYKSREVPSERLRRPDARKIILSLRNGFWALLLPVLIFGGIYSGVFTVTESAAVAAVYAIIAEIFIYRDMTMRDVAEACVRTAISSGTILLLVGAASVLATYMTFSQLPQAVSAWAFSFVESKASFLIITNIMLLIIGCLTDIMSATLILAPILKPLYQMYGMDDLHFGTMFLLNLYAGFLTPPVGINIFAAASLFGMPLMVVARAYVPFFLIILLLLALVVLVPPLTTWLPGLVLG